jgi:hypothetical protein
MTTDDWSITPGEEMLQVQQLTTPGSIQLLTAVCAVCRLLSAVCRLPISALGSSPPSYIRWIFTIIIYPLDLHHHRISVGSHQTRRNSMSATKRCSLETHYWWQVTEC